MKVLSENKRNKTVDIKNDQYKELINRKNNLPEWISTKVIPSCEHFSHIEPCQVIISFLEKKEVNESVIKKLQEQLQSRQEEILKEEEKQKTEEIEKKIWNMFYYDNYTIKQISEAVNLSAYLCRKIIDTHFKK